MIGADEYCAVFKKTEQIGRLLILPGSHARGATFHIYVLPKDFIFDSKKPHERGRYSVEVYGVISGQPGWTEKYGWLREGRWQDDFIECFRQRKSQIESCHAKKSIELGQKKREEELKINSVLDSY